MKIRKGIDYILQVAQLYGYLLPTVRAGNAIMDFRERHTLGRASRDADSGTIQGGKP